MPSEQLVAIWGGDKQIFKLGTRSGSQKWIGESEVDGMPEVNGVPNKGARSDLGSQKSITEARG